MITKAERPPVFSADLTNALTRWLLAAARRSASDDLKAVLLYRTVELSHQRRLAVAGVDSEVPVWTDPETLLAKLRRDHGYDRPELPAQVALWDARRILLALGDPVVAVHARKWTKERFLGLAELRNRSWYVHGFRPLALASVDKMVEMAREQALAVALADQLALPDPDPDYDPVRLGAR